METSNQKMREALELCDKIMSDVVTGARCISPLDAFEEMGGIINKALAAPPRNCDVGTADEQARRLDIYCSMHGKDESGCYRCEKCKLMRVDRCELAWAQMPYEGGGEK